MKREDWACGNNLRQMLQHLSRIDRGPDGSFLVRQLHLAKAVLATINRSLSPAAVAEMQSQTMDKMYASWQSIITLQSATQDWKKPALVNRFAAALRDLFGDPWRPYGSVQCVRCKPPFRPVCRLCYGTHWLPGVWPDWSERCLALAAAIYEARAFDDLAKLADALEEDGFADDAVTKHFREPGEHFLGCWALDAMCAKQTQAWVFHEEVMGEKTPEKLKRLRFALLLTEFENVEIDQLASWSSRQRGIAFEWAWREHVYANDNVIKRMAERPEFFRELKTHVWQ